MPTPVPEFSDFRIFGFSDFFFKISLTPLISTQADAISNASKDDLLDLVRSFEESGASGNNYGMSKLFLIAYTKVLATEFPALKINACCPGYCNTDMTKGRGPRDPKDGAQNAVLLTDPHCPHHGAFIKNLQPAVW